MASLTIPSPSVNSNGTPSAGSTPRLPPEGDLVARVLSAPFDPSEVKFKPAAASGNRALAQAYVDVRAIQDRLDTVCGVAGWQDSYRVLPDGAVVCRLRLKIGEEWITKVDVGSPSGQPDNGDRTKAAFSDALKRAAMKFGVGRYLYRLPRQWCDYDPHKREFARVPALPPWAVPVPSCIGPAGAGLLHELAKRKGVPLADYLGKVVGNGGAPAETLTADQARAVWKLLDVLPDARPSEAPQGPQPMPSTKSEPARSGTVPNRRRRRLPQHPADASDARRPREESQPVAAAQGAAETQATN
jgi:hypothetical protein